MPSIPASKSATADAVMLHSTASAQLLILPPKLCLAALKLFAVLLSFTETTLSMRTLNSSVMAQREGFNGSMKESTSKPPWLALVPNVVNLDPPG